jgi:hypothetical protein
VGLLIPRKLMKFPMLWQASWKAISCNTTLKAGVEHMAIVNAKRFKRLPAGSSLASRCPTKASHWMTTVVGVTNTFRKVFKTAASA